MTKTGIAFAALFAASATACASKPIPVPVAGTGASALVGEWSGEYSNKETGRNGTIEFSLRAGADTAYGSVVMVPRSSEPQVHNDQVQAVPMRAMPAQVLTIRFVRADGGRVVGQLDAYRDPDCGCQITTTFRGAFKDDKTIEGTFASASSAFEHTASSGRWTVTRTR